MMSKKQKTQSIDQLKQFGKVAYAQGALAVSESYIPAIDSIVKQAEAVKKAILESQQTFREQVLEEQAKDDESNKT